jgi:hydrogenase maturation protein HypF
VERAVTTVERSRVRVTGVVQGVGFRPFVHRLAHELGLTGLVGNDSTGVFVEVEGPHDAVGTFADRLVDERPPLAQIESVHVDPVAPIGSTSFEIVESAHVEGGVTLVPPDVAVCGDCLADVADASNRRYRYPFTNCTNCGPRFTIIRDLPYDRPNTTMAGFGMCPACADEYHDPADRRYHAQPTACPACGPHLTLHRPRTVSADAEWHRVCADTDDAVVAAVQELVGSGRVVAVKGLGGYHLACDATSDAAVGLLRQRKGRLDKPFAVMVPDMLAAAAIAELSDVETEALTSPAHPIVLVRRRADAPLSPAVAPGNPLVGVMLPYTPLHHLLFRPVPGADVVPPNAIVLTSGNRSDEPICFDDADARERLAGLSDAICSHDRPIEVPCDDSVVRVIDGAVQPIRRSRGYAPLPVALPVGVAPVVGVGGELKNTCCVASGRHAWVGQHIGDMENLETLGAFGASVDAFTRMYRVTPVAWGADLHPAYLTRRWALEHHAGAVFDVQHHHAHVAAVMAEHGLDGISPVLGFAFDGTGYGTAADGTVEIWGGEVLLADYVGFERVAHLAPLPLPGGDEGVRNPCRIAVAYLTALGLPLDPAIPAVAACEPVELGVVRRQVERSIGCVPTTSMGRLFDAVASLLGVRHRVGYEAQAAIELEALAEQGEPGAEMSFAIDAEGVIDPAPVLVALVDGVLGGVPAANLALAFHVAVADMIAMVVAHLAHTGPVALTGGVFQNALLATLARHRLVADGLTVLTHRLVPPNDGGLSLGQAVITGVRATIS